MTKRSVIIADNGAASARDSGGEALAQERQRLAGKWWETSRGNTGVPRESARADT